MAERHPVSHLQFHRARELALTIRASLESGSVAIACFDIDLAPTELSELRELLSVDEFERIARYRIPAVQQRFVACRGRLRMLLGNLVGIRPEEVYFEYGVWQKPYLATKHRSSFYFNISHSDGRAAMAFSMGKPVGVDLESGWTMQDRSVLAMDIFSEDELARWQAFDIDQRQANIVRTWVGKEALLKGLGVGASVDMRRISLNCPVHENRVSIEIDQEIASLAKQDPLTGDLFIPPKRLWTLDWFELEPDQLIAVTQPGVASALRVLAW